MRIKQRSIEDVLRKISDLIISIHFALGKNLAKVPVILLIINIFMSYTGFHDSAFLLFPEHGSAEYRTPPLGALEDSP